MFYYMHLYDTIILYVILYGLGLDSIIYYITFTLNFENQKTLFSQVIINNGYFNELGTAEYLL